MTGNTDYQHSSAYMQRNALKTSEAIRTGASTKDVFGNTVTSNQDAVTAAAELLNPEQTPVEVDDRAPVGTPLSSAGNVVFADSSEFQ